MQEMASIKTVVVVNDGSNRPAMFKGFKQPDAPTAGTDVVDQLEMLFGLTPQQSAAAQLSAVPKTTGQALVKNQTHPIPPGDKVDVDKTEDIDFASTFAGGKFLLVEVPAAAPASSAPAAPAPAGEDAAVPNAAKRARTLIGQPAPQDIEAFLRALRTADLDDTSLRLTGASLLANPDRGSVLFVRESYSDLWSFIQRAVSSGISILPEERQLPEAADEAARAAAAEQLHAAVASASSETGGAGGAAGAAHLKKFHKFLFTGNPGIGKTYFGLYLLSMLAKQYPDRTILYQHFNFGGDVWVIQGDDFRVASIDDVKYTSLRNPETWYVVDGMRPTVLEAPAITVLITSPNRENCREFQKHPSCVTRYLPIFTWEEIMTCRDLCYPDLLLPDVERRFDEWGGIPRYVLDKTEASAQTDLEKAIAGADLARIQNGVAAVSSGKEETHRILHIHVINTIDSRPLPADLCYLHTRLALASPFVADRVLMRLQERQSDELHQFIASASGVPELGSVRGQLFESLAHQLLSAGGKFAVRRLADGHAGPLELPKLAVKLFAAVTEISAEHYYWRPRSKRFPAIDALAHGAGGWWAFQMKVGPSPHTISGTHLQPIADKAGGIKLPFYFVVPEDVFSNSALYGSAQSVTGTLAQGVEQFVLSVPLHGVPKAS